MKVAKTINIQNKKAKFEYTLLDVFEAGLVLMGTEIKSIRTGKVNMSDGYCFIEKNEVFVKNINIAKYDMGTYYNHDPLRERKLLLTKREIKKLISKMTDKGLTIIPTKLFINDKGLAKLEIAIAKGKKLYDKRDSIKDRDVSRDQARFE